jgi:hypothetical protein
MASLTTEELKTLATMTMTIDSGRRTDWSAMDPYLIPMSQPRWSPYLPFSLTHGLDEQLPEFAAVLRRAAEQVQREEGRKVIDELDQKIAEEAGMLEEARRDKRGAKKIAAKRKINEAIKGKEARLETLKKHKQSSRLVLEGLEKR